MKPVSLILISLTLLPCILSQVTFPVKTRRMLGSGGPPITFNLTNSHYIDIQLGTPPQNISAVIDTGFGYFMVSSSSCNLPSNQIYNPDASSSVNYTLANNTNASILYYLSDAPQNVEVFADTFTIEGYSLENAEFLVSSTCESPVFGFGVRNESGTNLRTIAESFAKEYNTEQIASLYLPANNSEASFILGSYNETIAPNGFTYHNSTSSELWAVNITDFGLGNTSYFPQGWTSFQGLLTSGWEGINAVPYIFNSLLEELPANIDCSDVSKYPNLYFVIDDTRYEIQPSIYFTQQGLFQNCQPAISVVSEGIQITGEEIFFGTTFFNAFYTSFDIKKGTIGFSPIQSAAVMESISQ